MIFKRRAASPAATPAAPGATDPPPFSDGVARLAAWAGPGDVDARDAAALMARIAALTNMPETLAWLQSARADQLAGNRPSGELIEETVARDAGVDVVTILAIERAMQGYRSCAGRPVAACMLGTLYIISKEIGDWIDRNNRQYKGVA